MFPKFPTRPASDALPEEPEAPVQQPHSGPLATILRGDAPSIVASNTSTLKQAGHSELEATKSALKAARPSQHKNLGKFLHPRKDGKAHGYKGF
jgi:hypothetical protein